MIKAEVAILDGNDHDKNKTKKKKNEKNNTKIMLRCQRKTLSAAQSIVSDAKEDFHI